MNPDAVLAVLPDSKEEAKSLREIALAMSLDISTHTDWIRAERSLARVLRILIKWGWVARDKRQSAEGQKFWHNAYWKTELASHTDGCKAVIDSPALKAAWLSQMIT